MTIRAIHAVNKSADRIIKALLSLKCLDPSCGRKDPAIDLCHGAGAHHDVLISETYRFLEHTWVLAPRQTWVRHAHREIVALRLPHAGRGDHHANPHQQGSLWHGMGYVPQAERDSCTAARESQLQAAQLS